MPRLHAVNLVLRFLVELAALAGLGFWGWTAGRSTTGQWVLALATPVAAAWLWGMYAAPASRHRLAGRALLAVEWLVFGGAAIATAVAGLPWAAVAFVVVAAANAFVLAKTTREAPAPHSAGGCQCCSGGMGEVVRVPASTAGQTEPTQLAAPPATAPSTVSGSVASPRG